jgi:hypothetical protein
MMVRVDTPKKRKWKLGQVSAHPPSTAAVITMAKRWTSQVSSHGRMDKPNVEQPDNGRKC